MKPTEQVTLTMREHDRLKVIQAMVDWRLKPGLAAERLQLTVRQLSGWWLDTSNPVRPALGT